MKKIVYFLVFLVVLVGAGYWFVNQDAAAPSDNLSQNTSPTNNQQTTTPPAGNEPANTAPTPTPDPGEDNTASDHQVVTPPPASTTKTISITNDGFSPSTLEVAVGTTVIFKNDSVDLVWPASDPHPTHTGLAGFDADRALEPGESWSFKFTVAGTYGFHDHLNSSEKGSIVVN